MPRPPVTRQNIDVNIKILLQSDVYAYFFPQLLDFT